MSLNRLVQHYSRQLEGRDYSLPFFLSFLSVNIFSGRQSSLEMSQLYTLTYNCDFDLIMFPFDAQVSSFLTTLLLQ